MPDITPASQSTARQPSAPDTAAAANGTSVLYNAECSVCRFEIDHYRGYARNNTLPISFEDLNTTELQRWGLTADQAARRLYVRRGEEMLSGVPAFVALWSEMPRYRWLARLVAVPGVHWAACRVYDHVLAPILYQRQRHRYAGAEKSGKDAPTG